MSKPYGLARAHLHADEVPSSSTMTPRGATAASIAACSAAAAAEGGVYEKAASTPQPRARRPLPVACHESEEPGGGGPRDERAATSSRHHDEVPEALGATLTHGRAVHVRVPVRASAACAASSLRPRSGWAGMPSAGPSHTNSNGSVVHKAVLSTF